jgi:hypothetical protein
MNYGVNLTEVVKSHKFSQKMGRLNANSQSHWRQTVYN